MFTRGKFVLRMKGEPTFYVNTEKKTVVAKGSMELRVPFDWGCAVYIPDEVVFYGTAMSKCFGEDVEHFDEGAGKRIALAKLEDECYSQALAWLRRKQDDLMFFVNGIDKFAEKASNCASHNVEYINQVVNDNMNGKKLTAPFGNTVYTVSKKKKAAK